MTQFERDVENGKKGERFFYYASGHLLSHSNIIQSYTEIGNIEGSDICGYRQQGGYYTFEVKTWFNNTMFNLYIPRQPSIPFQMYTIPKGCKCRSEWKKGWLYSLLHPARVNEQNKEKNMKRSKSKLPYGADHCGCLVHLCCSDNPQLSSEPLQKIHPVLCVAFEQFDQLRTRLIKLAQDRLNLDLEKWDFTPDEYPERPPIWNVPLQDIQDLATISLLGNMPPNLTGQQACVYRMYQRIEDVKRIDLDKLKNELEQARKDAQRDNPRAKVHSITIPQFDDASKLDASLRERGWPDQAVDEIMDGLRRDT